MERVSALELRRSLGRLLQRLEESGCPILLEKDRKPAAVLISLEDYRKRFVDMEADDEIEGRDFLGHPKSCPLDALDHLSPAQGTRWASLLILDEVSDQILA